MTDQRYKQIFDNLEEKLTPEEISQGWHFCCEWDGLHINPSMDESWACSCHTDEEKEKFVSGYIQRMNDHNKEMEYWMPEMEQLDAWFQSFRTKTT